ncbi:hypothetical protein MSAN_01338900 [Mycena sanguinolenta]|uniref:Uncharacterized protein n=1 Tax=Mycena sanguinolenta TaxID=230812 RepID=A0A8H7D0I3_9AGAR|nr:hypothetical protein MSAN_01338900 [Mycena sanguinolenta]
MLLILPLVYLLAGHRVVSGLPLVSLDESVSCDSNVNSRSLFTILSGCLVTVFACTWVSVHPNVPPPNQSKLALFGRRLGLMLVAVVAPELIAGFAARQFLDARWFAKEYSVSITHGFFFAMGGFVSQGHHPIATHEQLRSHPEYAAAIQHFKNEDIEDKSKGDFLSKGVALIQGLWFIAQCLARVHQCLPLTQLEVATLAFQFVSVFIWVLWWYKPLDVQQPILIGPTDELVARAKRKASIVSVADVFEPIVLGVCSTFDPVTSTSVPAFWSTHGFEFDSSDIGFQIARFVRYFFIQFLTGTIFGIIHCAAWTALFPSTHERLLWRSCSLVVASVPLVLAVSPIMAMLFKWLVRNYITFKGVFEVVAGIVSGIAIWAYVVARLILIALAFTTLRTLPSDAFVDVNWTAYIPHF